MEAELRKIIEKLGVTRVTEILNEFTSEEKEPEVDRISRISPTNATQLKKILGLGAIDKKEFDKIKKEFKAYVNKLKQTDYETNDLKHHMEQFAKTKSTKTVEPEKPIPEIDMKDITQIPLYKIYEDEERFKLLENTKIAFDVKDGKWVGPLEEEDEYSCEITLNGKRYGIGERTKRVYLISNEHGNDVFVGFAGIGAFKNI